MVWYTIKALHYVPFSTVNCELIHASLLLLFISLEIRILRMQDLSSSSSPLFGSPSINKPVTGTAVDGLRV
jgi:hypothetical protein